MVSRADAPPGDAWMCRAERGRAGVYIHRRRADVGAPLQSSLVSEGDMGLALVELLF